MTALAARLRPRLAEPDADLLGRFAAGWDRFRADREPLIPEPAEAAPRARPAAADVSGVLSNVALVDAAVAACGGVERARRVAEAVAACDGAEAFGAYLEVVARIQGGDTRA